MSSPQPPNGQPPQPGVVPPGFTSPDAMAAMAEDQARAALRQQPERDQQIHDGLAEMLREDPALLIQKLPDLFGQAVAGMVAAGVTSAVQQILGTLGGTFPVKASRWCSECVAERVRWNAKHAADLEQATQLAMQAAEASGAPGPAAPQVDAGPFLPENLRPGAEPDGLPLIFDAVTTAGGTDVCASHHPAAAGLAAVASGRKQFLIANGSLTPAMIREAGGIPGAFGMAGVPAA